MMNPRTELILQKSVKDFIDTGRPITSEYLYENYEFGIKPAMIRRELNILDEEGYLEQVHTSGGRFPTNKAYQYFVDKVLKKEEKKRKASSKTDDITDYLLSGEMNLFLDNLSEFLMSLGILYEVGGNQVYDSGLEALFENLNWDSREEVISIIRDIESIAKTLESDSWWEAEEQWPQIFIGENPLVKSDHISVVANKFKINGRNEFILLTIGPKRMDYEKTFDILKHLDEVINNKNLT